MFLLAESPFFGVTDQQYCQVPHVLVGMRNARFPSHSWLVQAPNDKQGGRKQIQQPCSRPIDMAPPLAEALTWQM